MNESDFISANKKQWQELEKLLDSRVKDPDRLHELFIKVSSDLSYARTFYPNRTVRLYLNTLTQRVLDLIQSRKNKFSWSTITDYYTHTLPKELYRARYAFLVSLLIFSIAIVIGAISTAYDVEFTRVILSDQYVDMTNQNINDGDPMAVYKSHEQVDMFFGITLNNIRVAMIAFVMGLLGSIGTVIILLSNGIMLGSFQYFFYQKGLFLTSFLTIWIHGTLEISAIIIAGGAGLILGDGILNPKTYTRSLSIQVASKRAVRVLLSTVPLFIIAGFLESYVTRLTEAPSIIKISIIGISLCFILYHYIIHPWQFNKSHKVKDNDDDYRVQPSQLEKMITLKDRYRTFTEISQVSLAQFRFHLGSIFQRGIFPITTGVIFIYWIWAKYDQLIQRDYSLITRDAQSLFSVEMGGWQLLVLYELCIIHLYLVSTFAYQNISFSISKYLKALYSYGIYILLLTSPYLIVFYYFTLGHFLLLLIFFPPQIIFCTLQKCISEGQPIAFAFQSSFSHGYNRYSDYLKPLLLCSFIYYLLILTVSTISNLLYMDFLSWHNLFPGYLDNSIFIGSIFNIIISCLAYILFHFMYSNQYVSLILKVESYDLLERIDMFELTKKYGT